MQHGGKAVAVSAFILELVSLLACLELVSLLALFGFTQTNDEASLENAGLYALVALSLELFSIWLLLLGAITRSCGDQAEMGYGCNDLAEIDCCGDQTEMDHSYYNGSCLGGQAETDYSCGDLAR